MKDPNKTSKSMIPPKRSKRLIRGEKLRDAQKVEKIPVKIINVDDKLKKPDWLRIRLSSSNKITEIKSILRTHKMSTVCEEGACPNLNECFSHGTATFMIMGDICTRRCPFCDVGHGKPNPLDPSEPKNLAKAIAKMKLRYAVITSVDRDDLRDGGAQHFADCIDEIRHTTPSTKIEVLVPDFRGRMEIAIERLSKAPPNVFNHNLETIERLYREARPGANYSWPLKLLKEFRVAHKSIPTKSGLMVGLGETKEEIFKTMRDLRDHDVEMLTIGQYLQPSKSHLPVQRYVHPTEFSEYEAYAKNLGFKSAACGPLVRSSYHAEKQIFETAI